MRGRDMDAFQPITKLNLMERDPLQLEYAPAPRFRRWRARRWLLALLVIFAIWGLADWGPDAAGQVRMLWVQRRCANLEIPPGAVIFDTDPDAGAALLAQGQDYVALNDSAVWPHTGVARREPDCWTSFKTILFGRRNFWPPGPPAPKALVHRLRSAAGEERLVAIIVAPSAPLSLLGIGLVAAVVRPGNWQTAPRWEGNSAFLRIDSATAARLRFFAGQIDPDDASRFTIRYEIDGQSGTVDGKLEDDNDVSLKLRDGPAKTP
jgi:hypothetical protein